MTKLFQKIKIPILFLSSVFLLSSCKKFLDEKPSKTSSLVVNNVDQLDALFSNYGQFYSEGNRTAIYSTDYYGLTKEIYDARPGTFSMAAIEFALWDIDNLPDDGREGFWSGEFKKIFYANMALEYAEKVSGSKEDKSKLIAEAHFIRAYSYFQLANTYCLPYTEANKNSQGLPIKKTVSFEEPVARAPLSAVYELIESDLKEALKINVPLVQNGISRHWRASTAAVNGFAARYYLQMNNYTEALKYANLSLGEYNQLVNYNTEMEYGRDQTLTVDPGTPESQMVVLKYPYTHDNQSDPTDMIGWKEFLYYRMLNHESWWYIPSQSLLDLYDSDNDLRYKYHMVEDYSYDRGMTKPSFSYPGYIFFFKDRVPSGPTTAEMYLIKAECLARTNKVGEAMTALNILHSKRMKPGSPQLTAASQDEAIKVVLEERSREMPFSMRWFDLRRFNHNDYPNDDVELSRNFYPYTSSNVQTDESPMNYTLEKNSTRYAAPLPRTEMISSQGVIEQNNY